MHGLQELGSRERLDTSDCTRAIVRGRWDTSGSDGEVQWLYGDTRYLPAAS